MKIELKMRTIGSDDAWDKPIKPKQKPAETIGSADHTDKAIAREFNELRELHQHEAKDKGHEVEFSEHPMRHDVLRARSHPGEDWQPILSLPHNAPDLKDHMSAAKARAIHNANNEGRPPPTFSRRIELAGEHIDEVS